MTTDPPAPADAPADALAAIAAFQWAAAVPWAAQVVVALILLQTLYFKFTYAPETAYIFEGRGGRPAAREGTRQGHAASASGSRESTDVSGDSKVAARDQAASLAATSSPGDADPTR